MKNQVKAGIIGCGNISNACFAGCMRSNGLEVVVCADLDRARAEAKALEHAVRAGFDVPEAQEIQISDRLWASR